MFELTDNGWFAFQGLPQWFCSRSVVFPIKPSIFSDSIAIVPISSLCDYPDQSAVVYVLTGLWKACTMPPSTCIQPLSTLMLLMITSRLKSRKLGRLAPSLLYQFLSCTSTPLGLFPKTTSLVNAI